MGADTLSKIKNKIKRQQLFRDAKHEKHKQKLAVRKTRAQAEKADPKLKEVQFRDLFPADVDVCIGAAQDQYPRDLGE
jgi:hypothetical protein